MISNNPPSSDGLHDEVATLLPWYLNGTLQSDEQRRVKTHIARCPACRRELAALHGLADQVVSAPLPERSPQAAYDRWFATLQQGQTAGRLPGLRRRATKSLGRRFVFARRDLTRLALAATVLLPLISLGWRQMGQMAEPSFHTLSDRAPAAAAERGDLRLVFDKAVAAPRIDGLLQAIGGSRVGAPGPGDVYTIRLSGKNAGRADIDAAIAYLRQQEGVVLAEPIITP